MKLLGRVEVKIIRGMREGREKDEEKEITREKME